MHSTWDIKKIAIGHRTGTVLVGEPSVVIAVSSAHRREALEVCPCQPVGRWGAVSMPVKTGPWRRWGGGEGEALAAARAPVGARKFWPLIVALAAEGVSGCGTQAVHWAIDELKATVPIWKKEFFTDGSVWKENAESRLHL